MFAFCMYFSKNESRYLYHSKKYDIFYDGAEADLYGNDELCTFNNAAVT